MNRKITAVLTLAAVVSVPLIAIAQVAKPTGTFAFLSRADSCADGSSSCFLTSPQDATQAVNSLRQIGVTDFLLPSSTLAEMQTIGAAVQAQNLRFYTYERWEWEAAKGSCEAYKKDRVDAELIPLRNQFGGAFAGVQFKDEPGTTEIDSYRDLRNCLAQVPQLSDLKVFVNLVPLNANAASLSGSAPKDADSLDPSAYGVDCSSNRLISRPLAQAMVDNYSNYARRVAEEIVPDYLAFNFYPVTNQMANCSAARELVMSENMAIISLLTRIGGTTSVAYLQNVKVGVSAPRNPEKALRYANFHSLRWYAAWFFAFGGDRFSNFLSHDNTKDIGNEFHYGLLNAGNAPGLLASDQQSTYGFTSQVASKLDGFTYQGYVAPWLGVPTGGVVGWLPSQEVTIGEYGVNTDHQALLFVARRPMVGTVDTVVGLSHWWDKVEMLNFNTGLWELQATSTNEINVSLGAFPGALYRLTVN
ncbi:hypothetical protein IB223_01695 [Pseudoxanthomonas sp. PXM03]|uniref:hypothetical protein n=1 Tax=Pseudoxanthomonas sp. PXM03 TaxID=2769284 RepID=UPI001784F011|nr:hypothetical protein [Pseudoxanthomonas sp. PXM03]MBD9434791.1 hypothetical protein [Pseudoxanthomonas sp. PXM03]